MSLLPPSYLLGWRILSFFWPTAISPVWEPRVRRSAGSWRWCRPRQTCRCDFQWEQIFFVTGVFPLLWAFSQNCPISGWCEDISWAFQPALRALGLLLADGGRTVGRGGGRLLTGQSVFFFTKTAVTPERKVGKSFPRWEMNGLSEGYKQAVYQIFWPKTEILGPKKMSHFWGLAMFWPRPKKVVQRKKLPFPK